MELRHLRSVVTLSQELNFGKAAARLNISQPPFSRQIRQIEDELGVELFRRTRRHVEVTEVGQIFIAQARQILAQTEGARHLVREACQGEKTQLLVGFPPSSIGSIMNDILRTFGSRYPNVRVALRSLSTAEQVRALQSGEIHVGFLRLPILDSTLKIEVILREPLIIALPECNRFASRERVPLQALADETFIMFPREMNPGYYDLLLNVCRSAGFVPKIAPEADNTYTALTLVASGLGVSLQSASAGQLAWKGVVFRDLQPAAPSTELAVAYSNQVSNSLSAFLKVAREMSKT